MIVVPSNISKKKYFGSLRFSNFSPGDTFLLLFLLFFLVEDLDDYSFGSLNPTTEESILREVARLAARNFSSLLILDCWYLTEIWFKTGEQ